MEDEVRRELDLLHQTDRDLREAITNLDNHGTRGVLQLTAQVTELIKDFAEMKLVFSHHEEQHTREKADARKTRRWIIGTLIAGIMAGVAIIALLIDIRYRIPK